MVLEETGDTERVVELIEALGLGGYLAPLTVGVTSGIGVREDDDLVIDQGRQEFCLECLETTTREPHEIGEFLTKDYRGFLRLHDTDSFYVDHGFNGLNGFVIFKN